MSSAWEGDQVPLVGLRALVRHLGWESKSH